jgi:hypothetical protein
MAPGYERRGVWGRRAARAFVLALALPCVLNASEARPLVAVLVTCASLASDIYPADTQNWFDAGHNQQVVFYAQLLFPVAPLPDESQPEALPEPWHPPMVAPQPDTRSGGNGFEDRHYAEAEWLDPAGKSLADFGMTLTARVKSDWIEVAGRAYVPHTFAMAIGIQDLRASAGQTRLPDTQGQYTVRLKVDGRSVGLAFFRMLHNTPHPVVPPGGRGPAGASAPVATPVPIPTLAPLRLP